MSDRPIDQDVGPSRDFVPEVNALEARNLPSAVIPRGDSIVWHPNPPRTGGIAVQSGSVLSCFVGQTRENVVQVTDDGKGDVAMSWNFGQPHSFQGVATSIIQAQRARTDQITFNLNAPRTSPVAVAVGSLLVADAHTPGGGGHALNLVHNARTSGLAVQSGSVLTVTVDRPSTNVVKITNQGGGAVQVEWNGGPAHPFQGVETMVVDTRNARKDQVTLTDPAP